MRKVLLEFRTPQRPSLGANNWGGASPLLARNIPKESLEQKYTRLNTIRDRDEIFPADHDDYSFNHSSQNDTPKHEYSTKRSYKSNKGRGRGILFKLFFQRKEKTVTLGWNLKKRIRFPRLDPQNRWPNGWC